MRTYLYPDRKPMSCAFSRRLFKLKIAASGFAKVSLSQFFDNILCRPSQAWRDRSLATLDYTYWDATESPLFCWGWTRRLQIRTSYCAWTPQGLSSAFLVWNTELWVNTCTRCESYSFTGFLVIKVCFKIVGSSRWSSDKKQSKKRLHDNIIPATILKGSVPR